MTTFSMVTCFVCDSEFWTEKRDKTTKVNSNCDSNGKEEEEGEKDWILFCKCLNVPQIEIDEYKKYLCNKSKLEERIGADAGLFSLCPKCSVVKGKILILNEQLESIQFKLKEISNQLTNTIKNTQEKDNKKNGSINTRKSGRGQNNTYSNEGIQRLRQTICDQTKSADVPKSKKNGENADVLTNSMLSLLPLNSGAIPTKETEREEEEREQFDVDDEGDDFMSSSNIKQEVESESDGEYENPNQLSQEEEEEEEEEESDKEAAGENEEDHPDFFYGIYEFLSTSIVDTNPNPEQNQNLNENENENENPSLENNPDSEAGDKIMDKPPRKRRKVQTPEEWIANIQKRKRMLGEKYLMKQRKKTPDGSFKYTRLLKPARVLGGPCRCVGKGRECDQIQEEDRQTIFHKFWKQMDWDEKKLWVQSAIVVTRPKRPKNMPKKKKKKKKKKKPGKRKRKGEEDENSSSSDSADEMNVNVNQSVNVDPNVKEHKKEVTLKYFLPLRDHRKIVVCKSMFLSTLGIREGSLHGWLKESTASLRKKE